MRKWIKDFLKDRENQELITNNEWEKLYEKLTSFINTMSDDDLENVWELALMFYNSGIEVLNCKDLKSIPPHMFYGCSSDLFNVIDIPNHITSIEVEAFALSESIKRINLPISLREISIYAFAYSDIKEIYYPGTLEEFLDNIFLSDTIFEGSSDINLHFKNNVIVRAGDLDI